MAFQTEIGRWSSLTRRARFQTAAVVGAVAAFDGAMIQTQGGA
jgi:hypothetical protein